ncbi:MAG: hypothetical protein KJ667_04690 [Alphaproteobacteria bacterium]|nr:hypothetical protein [Alphaproteobacteria bacterium]
MFKLCRLALLASLFAVVAGIVPAHAEDGVRKLGDYGAWQAYSYIESDGSKVCYMAAEPTKHEGKYSKRGKIYAQVTHRPGENQKDTFSYIAGYDYKAGSAVNLNVDSTAYELFTDGDTAWASDAATDGQIAQSLRKGTKMVVKGTSSRGTATVDTFSLSGSGAAHDAISKECGV